MLSGYVFATKAIGKKNLLNSSISSTFPHNMVNFGTLTAEIGWWVWGTPANYNGFRVLASLLHWLRSTEVNQTLHSVWPSPGLVHSIYILGGSCPLRCQVQNWLCVPVLRSPILAALLHCTQASAKLCGVVQGMELRNFSIGRHLYSAGQPSRWASAHILVNVCLCQCFGTVGVGWHEGHMAWLKNCFIVSVLGVHRAVCKNGPLDNNQKQE